MPRKPEGLKKNYGTVTVLSILIIVGFEVEVWNIAIAKAKKRISDSIFFARVLAVEACSCSLRLHGQ